jgi:predicted porin
MEWKIKMKKTALSLAIAAVLPAFANAEKVEVEMPSFYGKVNVSVQNTQEGDDSISEVVSNASRLGVKGKIQLNHGLEGIYQFEYETQVDDGDKGGQTFAQRNIFAGIKGGFGQVIVGMFDTPLKKAQKKIDLFNDLEGDIKSAITKSDKRKKDSIQYSTPKMSGLVATVAHIASEDETLNDGTSSSLTFTQDNVYAAIAYDTDVNIDTDVLRLVAQYSMSDFTVAALWEQDNRAGSDNDVEGWVYSASYKLNSDIKLKAQYGESDIVKDNAKTYSLGADYKLGKGAKAYAFVTDEEYGDDSSKEYYGVGLEYKF